MNFDPAIAAQQALQQAEERSELGTLTEDILEAEEIFSTDQGQEAKQAYETLQRYGEKLPQAKWFQEFLIYITWQQVTEGPLARYFQHGLDACDRFLKQFEREIQGTPTHQYIVDIRKSFQGGLGIETEDIVPEHEEDAFQGGD
jgi:DnaJ-domain-containing protein 1